jgi:nucleotide-binding universal stress UspA family protein
MTKQIKILIATDFSEASENAFTFVNHLFGGLSNLEVTYLVVHAFSPSVPYSDTPSIPVMSDSALESALELALEQAVLEKRKKINKKHQIFSFFDHGAVNQVVEKLIDIEKPDLVVMGTRERSAFERMTLGANTMEVASTINRPLLAIPREARPDNVKKLLFTSNLEPFKISSGSHDLLETLLSIVNAKLLIAHVFASGNEREEDLIRKMRESPIHRYLSAVPHSNYPIKHEDVYEGLVSFIEQEAPDLIIMTPGERRLAGKLFHNSKTEKLIYHAQLPLLMLA